MSIAFPAVLAPPAFRFMLTESTNEPGRATFIHCSHAPFGGLWRSERAPSAHWPRTQRRSPI